MSADNIFADFEVQRLSEPLFSLAGHDIAFTNTALFMFISVMMCTMLMTLAMRSKAVVPGRWQMVAEKIYNLVGDMLESNAGEKAKPFFPLIFTVFTFILFSNLSGLIPHSASVTSHVIVNFAIAIMLFTVIITTGFARHGIGFLKLFLPKGIPVLIAPVMMFIELFSFLIRPFSLSIRLFGNMLAGHLLLHVFAGLTATLLGAGLLAGFSIFPFLLEIVLLAFEFFVAFLQAYIYAVLASVYLHDAIEMH